MKVEIDKDKRGDWRWRVMAGNNRIVATGGGDGYRRRCDMVKAMRKVLHPDLAAQVNGLAPWRTGIKALLLAGAIGLLAGCASFVKPGWEDAAHASCWTGANASVRLMNILSPHMDKGTFEDRVRWMKDRGCDTAHVFLANRADGQYAGYCIYGPEWTWNIDGGYCDTFRERIKYLRRQGLAVVVWLMADDSAQYAKAAAQDPQRYIADLDKEKLLSQASTVVAGLEMNEYWNSGQVGAVVGAIRGKYSGKVGTHQTSGRCDYAGMADIVFYQVNPGQSAAWIQAEAARIKAATGKPLNFFEIERQEDRAKSEAAIRGGAFGVGNW